MADILLAAWKGPQEFNGRDIINDESIYYSTYPNAQGQWEKPKVTSDDFKSWGGPGLANHNGKVYMAWGGPFNDYSIYYSSFDGNSWTPKQYGPSGNEAKIDTPPALTSHNNKLYIVWKGPDTNIINNIGYGKMYYSSFDGGNWAPPAEVKARSSDTTHGPGLAAYNFKLYVAWKWVPVKIDVGGPPWPWPLAELAEQKRTVSPEELIFWSASFDGGNWAPTNSVRVVDNSHDLVGTSNGPYLSYHERDSRLYVSWKGKGNDQTIWWSSFDGSNWAQQTAVPNAATYSKPAIASFQGDIYLAWKGMNEDQKIYWIRPNTMPSQQLLTMPDQKGTNMSPALATWYSPWPH